MKYDLGLYKEALDLFQNAYYKSHVAELLINIGRSLDHLNRPQEAIDKFHLYLVRAPDSRLIPEVRSFIEEAQQHLSVMHTEESLARQVHDHGMGPAVALPSTSRLSLALSPESRETQAGGRSWVIAGGIVDGLGLTGLLVGVGCDGALMVQRSGVFSQTADEFDKRTILQHSQGLDIPLIAGYTIGAVMLTAGTLAIGYGVHKARKERNEKSSMKLAVEISNRLTGVTIEGVY